MNFRLFILGMITLVSCTPNPCPDLTLRKPNYYEDRYLTYSNELDQNRNYKLYTGRCSTYELDTLSSIRQYKDGYDHGKWKFFYKNGEVETKGKFDMGKRVGKWSYYYDTGELSRVSSYSNGIRDGLWFGLDISGDTIWTERYKNGKIVN